LIRPSKLVRRFCFLRAWKTTPAPQNLFKRPVCVSILALLAGCPSGRTRRCEPRLRACLPALGRVVHAPVMFMVSEADAVAIRTAFHKEGEMSAIISCSSVSQTSPTTIMARVLPPGALPELLATVRQKSARGREIANLFRKGRVAEALDRKREDGTAMLVGGDYDQVVGRIASFYTPST